MVKEEGQSGIQRPTEKDSLVIELFQWYHELIDDLKGK